MASLLIEPFYCGSHRQLIDLLHSCIPNSTLVTLPGRKWHWKARTGALSLFNNAEICKEYKTLFCSSVLNLAELLALVPTLQCAKKVVYFHENQLVYPVRKQQERDFQYGYNEILTCLVADVVVFNSIYNRNSFLGAIPSFMKLIPDNRPNSSEITEKILSKSKILYFPLQVDRMYVTTNTRDHSMLCICWSHRWEHDKNPEPFFNALYNLHESGCSFRLLVLGDSTNDVPACFAAAKDRLSERIVHWGNVENREAYYGLLSQAHVVVSTANHETFGVAMLEAVQCGALPLVPNRLVYPELYPARCIYKTDAQLTKRLREYARNPHACSSDYEEHVGADFCNQFSWSCLKESYFDIFR